MNKVKVKMSGCYKWSLMEEYWDTLSLEEKTKLLKHNIKEDNIKECLNKPWNEIQLYTRKRIMGDCKVELVHFSNRKFKRLNSKERRLLTCPNSQKYESLPHPLSDNYWGKSFETII